MGATCPTVGGGRLGAVGGDEPGRVGPNIGEAGTPLGAGWARAAKAANVVARP